jgi:ATP-binding cassette subfamily C protein
VFIIVQKALAFMTPAERAKYFAFLGLRSIVALFDLFGILAIGFLATSIALFVTLGSDMTRAIDFGGVSIPAVTAQTLPVVAVLILTLFLAKAVISIILTQQLAYFLARIEARAARKVADRAFGSGLGEARLHSREDVYFAVQAGSPAIFNTVMNSLGTIAAEGLLFLLVITSFFVVDPFSAIGTLIYFALIGAVIQLFIGNQMQKASVRSSEGIVAANTAIGDLSEALREATILGKKDFYFQRLYEARIRASSSQASQLTLAGMPRYIIETALMIAVALLVSWHSTSGDLLKAASTLGIFLSGGLRLTASLLPLQGALLSIKQSIPLAEKVLQFLGDQPHGDNRQIRDTRRHAARPIGAADVKLEEVSFTYPGSFENALRRVTLEVRTGQQVAIIGPSGAGKSTIADLILGLLSPTEGKILVAGESPSQIVLDMPGRLAYVPQRPGIVTGTVLENIALGVQESDLNQESLKTSIETSHLTHVIERLPEGIHTNLGKRKDELSGGQLQRIGLARALYSKPGLLVMDEATSALDAESENEINRALDEMRGAVTVILIAHRLNTVQRSDFVFLVEEGRITDSGTFPELLKSNKTVQNLAKLMSIDSADHSKD